MEFSLSDIPVQYVIHMLRTHGNGFRKQGDHYICGCPICHEGKSWGKKRRLYYFPNDNYIHCHNQCGTFTPYQWIKQVTGWDYTTIRENVDMFCGPQWKTEIIVSNDRPQPLINVPDLPDDSTSVLDATNHTPLICHAKQYIHDRRLATAAYSCNNFYVTSTDFIHKNRLIIPFYDKLGKVISYQSRTLDNKDTHPKYLTKLNGDKPLFNFDKVDPELGYYFVFEGAIDAMFCRNAVASGGVVLTEYQRNQLGIYDMFMKRIWVLDNPYVDSTARERTIELISQGETIFAWPRTFDAFKDFNALAVAKQLDEVPYQLILKCQLSGPDAKKAIL